MAMSEFRLQLTYIGGPTAGLELGGLRLLTDPTFDPGGSEYRTPVYVLRKTQGPALAAEAVTAAQAFPRALILPLHFEGWAHFSESRGEIAHAFAAAGLAHRLRWPIPGQALDLSHT